MLLIDLYYKLYIIDNYYKWAFSSFKSDSLSCDAYPWTSLLSNLSPHFLERIVALNQMDLSKTMCKQKILYICAYNTCVSD